jgi:Ca2+-binding EF-hand superfamily protein
VGLSHTTVDIIDLTQDTNMGTPESLEEELEAAFEKFDRWAKGEISGFT